jgi:hypothetical protein
MWTRSAILDPARPGCGDAERDPRLRELTTRAQALILALRRGAPRDELRPVLAAYVHAARAIDVTGERLHDALELLVHEHAPARRLAAITLRDVLRLADPHVLAERCPHITDSSPAPVAHWCRMNRRTA